MRHFTATIYLLLTAFAGPLFATPAQVIIIPNGEIDGSGNLTQEGLERAGALAAYITFTPALTQSGDPVSIFAARPTPGAPDNTQACIQTAGPTANMLKLPIHSGYAPLQEAQIASFILNNRKYNDKNILICWRPEDIQALAAAFGVSNPPAFSAGTFNVTWLITFSPSITLQIFQQNLLFGD